MTTHYMKLGAEPFADIGRGAKTVEARLYDEKRRQVHLGDTIIFSLNDDPARQITARVIGLLRYDTFETMYRHNEPAKFGKPTVRELLAQVAEFYSLDDQAKNGVLGIEFTLL